MKHKYQVQRDEKMKYSRLMEIELEYGICYQIEMEVKQKRTNSASVNDDKLFAI